MTASMSTSATSSIDSSCTACCESRLRSNTSSSKCASSPESYSYSRLTEGHRTHLPPSAPRVHNPSSFHQSECCRQQRCLFRTPPVILLVILVILLDFTSQAAAKTNVVPRFTQLPPPIVYRARYHSAEFQCKVYPRSVRLGFLRQGRLETAPSIIQAKETHGIAIHKINDHYISEGTDYFCRALTDFGMILSRPFRVAQASLKEFSVNEPSQTLSFYKGNVAQVLCSIPKSRPAATVYFLKDGVQVGHSDKYLTAKIPGREEVALLIKEFSSSDVGNYSCKASNPYVSKEVHSKAVTRLTLKKASSAFNARLHVKYPFYKTMHHNIYLREGDNITLYCLPEGAPIPTVKWFTTRQRGDGNDVGGSLGGGLPKGAKESINFGAIHITNIRADQACTMTCSIRQAARTIDRTFQLRVTERLKISNPPKDTAVTRLGSNVTLNCEAVGGTGDIKLQWYFNSEVVTKLTSHHLVSVETIGYGILRTTMKIPAVTTDLFGIYQCVARTDTEWASATASVYMYGDTLEKGEKPQPAMRTYIGTEGLTAMMSCNISSEEEKNNVMLWYRDNSHIPVDHKNTNGRFQPSKVNNQAFFNLFKPEASDAGIYRCVLTDNKTGAAVRTEYINFIVKSATKGGINPNPIRRPIIPIDEEVDIRKSAAVVPTERNPNQRRIKPGGGRRQNRNKSNTREGLTQPVVQQVNDNLAVNISWRYTGDLEVESFSLVYRCYKKPTSVLHDLKSVPSASKGWSSSNNLISNYHKTYYLVAGTPLQPGYVYKFRVIALFKSQIPGIKQRKYRSAWSYEMDFDMIMPVSPNLVNLKVLSKTAVEVAWTFNDQELTRSGDGLLDSFIVAFREQLKDKTFDQYFSHIVRDGNARRSTISGLKPGTNYQFVVYGVRKTTETSKRKVTLFSKAMIAQTMSPTMLPPGAKKAESNRVTFLIMGCVAGLLIVIVAVLMSICLWRQRKEKRRMRGTNSASSQLLLSNLGDGTVWSQHQHLGQGVPPLPLPRHNHHTSNGGVRLNPEAASLMLNYDDRFSPLPPPLPPTGTMPTATYYGNGNLRRESNTSRSMGKSAKTDGEPMYATRGSEDPLYATRLHPAYAVTSPVGSIYPLPALPAPLGGPPGRFSPYAVAVPPMHAGGDGAESVYSYFSQQEAGTHTDGPTPYTASRTVDRPRHHRRKRRRPTNTTCSQSGLESGSETGPPHMKDMAVNTDMSSSDAIYESSLQASTTASPPPRMGALMMGAMTELPACTPAAYKSPPGAPDLPPPPPPVHPILSTPLTSVASSSSPCSSSGPPSSHTLTRRGTPNLFLDPPRVRDYQEYGVSISPETGGNGGPVVPAV